MEKNLSCESQFIEGGSDLEESRTEFVYICAREAGSPEAERSFFCLPAHEWYTICGIAEPDSLLNRLFVEWLAQQPIAVDIIEQIVESLGWKSSWERVYDMSLCSFQSFASSDICEDWQEEILEKADDLYSRFMAEQKCVSLEKERFSLLAGYKDSDPDSIPLRADQILSQFWTVGADRSELPCSVAALLKVGFRVCFCCSTLLSLAEAGADAEYTSFYLVTPPAPRSEEKRTFAVKLSKVNQPGTTWSSSGQLAFMKLPV
ncbi:MAG: hypothetical protein ACI38Q_04965 [Candidatus Bruticola sp.]